MNQCFDNHLTCMQISTSVCLIYQPKLKTHDTPYITVRREYMFGQSLIVELQYARGKLLLLTLQHYGITGSEKESLVYGEDCFMDSG